SMDAAVGVYDRSGRRLAGTGPASAGALVRQVARTGGPAGASRGSRLVVSVPVLHGERVGGIVRAERSATDATSDTRGAWLILAAIAAAIIAAATAAALLLGRRLAAPLERLTVAARAPRAGTL